VPVQGGADGVSDLGWRAEGIRRAKAAGGVELEVYRRPGFIASLGVRRLTGDERLEVEGRQFDPGPPRQDDPE
jgi:hypothetical protein